MVFLTNYRFNKTDSINKLILIFFGVLFGSILGVLNPVTVEFRVVRYCANPSIFIKLLLYDVAHILLYSVVNTVKLAITLLLRDGTVFKAQFLKKSKRVTGVIILMLIISALIPFTSIGTPTAAEPSQLTQKWVANVEGGGEALLTADIRPNIPGEEVVHCGGGVQPSSSPGQVTVINGQTGSVIQTRSIDGLGDTAQAQMADVDNDGRLEIIVPLQQPAGLYILNSEDLSTLWNAPGTYSGEAGYFINPSGGRVDSSPVIGDIDGDGFKDIFVGVMAYEEQPETGSIRHLEFDSAQGVIVERNVRIVWHPCAGGFSLGDTDNDGSYELYMADRSIGGMSDGSWGRGLRSFWADNLTSRWDVYDNMMSSNIPMLADVNGDGIKDIVATDLDDSVLVLNSTNGHPLINDKGVTLRTSVDERRNHYQSSVYDIDGDGNLEILSADGFESEYDNVTVWDLWDWKLDASINTTLVGSVPTRSWKGPTVGEVTGDGVMDMIVTTFEFANITDRGMVQVYDHNFDLVAYTANNLVHRALDSIVQDVDRNDGGLNELLVLSQGGKIYCYDTLGIASNPRARSEVQFYSESRNGASEYVPFEPQQNTASHLSPTPYPNVSNDNSYSLENEVAVANLIFPFDTKTDPELAYSGFAYTNDYSSYGNIGNVFGASWTSDGVVGGAYSFDSNDFIRVDERGISLGGDGTWGQISVEFWIKATANINNETLLWKHDRYDFSNRHSPAEGVGYRVDFAADAISNQVTWYVYTENMSNPDVPTEYVALANINGARDWHHVVCTYKSGEGLRIYVDGAQSASLPGLSGNILATNRAERTRYVGNMLGDWGYTFPGGMVDTNKGLLEIARDRNKGDFQGMLDELRIYRSSLSADQVSLRYKETRQQPTPTPIPTSTPTPTITPTPSPIPTPTAQPTVTPSLPIPTPNPTESLPTTVPSPTESTTDPTNTPQTTLTPSSTPHPTEYPTSQPTLTTQATSTPSPTKPTATTMPVAEFSAIMILPVLLAMFAVAIMLKARKRT